jgi:hypothetical protein
MAIAATLIGTRGTSSSNTVTTGSGTSTGGSGNHGVLCLSWQTSSTISGTITDSKSNTFTAIGSAQSDGNGGSLQFFIAENWVGGTSHTVTVNFSAAAFPTAHLIEVTGATSSTPQDINGAGSDASSPWTITTGTFAQAVECVLSAVAENTGGVGSYASSTDTVLSEEPDTGNYYTSGVGYRITSSTSAITPSWTNAGRSGNAAIIYLALKEGSGDTTAPTLTSPTGTATGSTTAQGQVSTDEANGTMYAVVSTSATPPSVAQIQAGNDSTGSAGAWSGNQSITTTGTKTFNATGLTASTGYYFYFQHRDAAANDSTVAASSQFTTNAPTVDNAVAWIRA